MPEYLSPGVYVEEVSFRSKSIEGVPTSTTGFAGLARFGPVYYSGGPSTSEPRLITSFTEFEQVYGGLELLHIGASKVEQLPYMAHAARAFFDNGGKRLYVSRVFKPIGVDAGLASVTVTLGGGAPAAIWQARWPGDMGNFLVQTKVVRSKKAVFVDPVFGPQLKGVNAGAVVEITAGGGTPPVQDAILTLGDLRLVDVDTAGQQTFRKSDNTFPALLATDLVQLVEMQVVVSVDFNRVDVYDQLAADERQKRYIGRILEINHPEDENAVVYLNWKAAAAVDPLLLVMALRGSANPGTGVRLQNGNDGDVPGVDDLAGADANVDHADIKATGLAALGEVDDIAIVALPDGGTLPDSDQCAGAADRLISHCERYRYRIGVIDAPVNCSMTDIRNFRGRFDSKYAALYHPWIEIFDPTERPSQGAPPKRLLLPPSGFVTGIYARSDIERGVHKAPANEVVRGLTRFESNINKGRQDVLNPEGINALRFFEGRGNRVWGARTISSDPEWKYVNVRRLFIYIEHSLDKGTQWAVFEPNNSRLWANIRETVENFLLVLWKDGALLGDKPEEAYFVRCDRTTMTQNDLDNGRLICLVGVAPVKPAEFVIFRVGQWTADAKQ
jgi:phage tail sheath protein FI